MLKNIEITIKGKTYGTRELSAYDAVRLKTSFSYSQGTDVFDAFMKEHIGNFYVILNEHNQKYYFLDSDEIKKYFKKDGKTFEEIFNFFLTDFNNSFLEEESGENMQI